ncbi:cysteine desulfurase-like protein [Homoserinimonas sp. OAct 916]|uniref:cysteine desulfurase-like protein n=1 Tax=Homoserinimonas sp. OAct 916 TaxID=2211450 RepID=UPI000DBE123A|nr:cysteine desulfurase-like protein [Homoserinimonas sp. OAct 916]
MSYDVSVIRAAFPALDAGCAHFDGPGGTQTPRPVIDAIAGALAAPLSNRGTTTVGEANAEKIVLEARAAIADLVGGDAGGVVFGRSATALAYDFSRMLSATWNPGDEVVVTRLDHDSNIRPWVQAAEHVGATLRWVDFDPATGELPVGNVVSELSENTRLVAITAASNLIGTKPRLAEIASHVHAVGALLYVDGVHFTAHELPDVETIGADFYTCSPYKFLGPHLGALVAAPSLLETLMPDKLLPSTNDVPERFEFGTLPYEMLAGVTAAVDYLADLDPTATGSRRQRLEQSFSLLHVHEDMLLGRLEAGLAAHEQVTVYSRAAERTPTILFTVDGHDAVDVYTFLAKRGVDAPASNFYALEASRALGLGDEGGVRVGLAPYSSEDDIDRLLAGLAELLA